MTFPSDALRHLIISRPVYIAAPYRAPSDEGRTENVRRACQLARLVYLAGGVPVVVHPAIAAGVYGDPGEWDVQERQRGLLSTLMLAIYVRDVGGLCVALTREDGSLSEGVLDEVRVFSPNRVFPVYPSELKPHVYSHEPQEAE